MKFYESLYKLKKEDISRSGPALKNAFQDDPLWKSMQLDLDSRYTLEEIINLRETLQCDAVLLGTITEFRPYPHMIIGLRLRLLDLRDVPSTKCETLPWSNPQGKSSLLSASGDPSGRDDPPPTCPRDRT